MPDPVFLSGSEVPEYLRGVELMTAGMEWQASTGPVTITLEHIADAIKACNEDPHIQPPRIKLGHTSQINGDHPNHDPFAAIGDAEPAFGVFGNLAAANDGAVLTGDADRILTWLALSAPATYPNRSSEATWQVAAADFDVQTAGGKRYSMVVTAVSLLGVYLPAISDLEDLSTLIMSGPSALTTQPPVAAAATPGTALSVSEDEIRQRFNWEWAMDDAKGIEMDTYWWWAREVQVTNGEVIADDDEGHLWQVPFTEKDGVVTFAEPEQVRKTYVPMAAASGQVVASFTRPSKPQRPPVAAGSNPAATERPNTEGGEPMDTSVREFLVGQGHDPETATTEQITAAEAYCAAFPAPATPAATTTDEPESPEAAADTPEAEAETPAPESERVPVAAARQIPEGMSLIDSTTLADLKAGAAAGTQLAREKAVEARDRVLLAARDEGRIPPSRIEHYTRLYDSDPEGTTVLLTAAEDKGGLAKGTVPLAARAVTPDPEAAAFAANEPLPAGVSILSPSERAESRARRA